MSRKAERFAELHAGQEILVLPNAWDAASAAILADAGAKAVATSSAAVAWAHGYPDGDALPLEKLIATVTACAKAAGETPLSADIEGGYTDDLAELAETVKAVIGAGAVGINLEDGARAPELHARKIAAARKAADEAGVALFINARTDVYLKRLAQGDAAEAETLKRARLFADAGASGIFVPGPSEAGLIGRLAQGVPLPLNIMLLPGLPTAAELQALGVARLSTGTAPFGAAYARLKTAAAEFLATGAAAAFANDGVGNLNQRFS